MVVNLPCFFSSTRRTHCAPRRSRRAGLAGVAAIAIAAGLACRADAAENSSNQLSADQQLAIANGEHAQAQIEITRTFLEDFADNLTTLAEFGKIIYDFRDLKLPTDASPAEQAFFAKIRPIQDVLAQGGREVPDHYDLLSNIYDLAGSLRQDLERPASDPLMAVLSSQSLEKLGSMGLAWIASDDRLQQLVKAGKISKPFAQYAGFLSSGADDLAAGIARGIGSGTWKDPDTISHLFDGANAGLQKLITEGKIPKPFANYAGALAYGADDLVAGVARGVISGNWQDPETISDLLDAANRGSWAAVGFLVSGGNREVTNLFSSAAGFAAEFVRAHSVEAFADAYIKLGGVDQAILDTYASAQQARIAHNQAPVSFEQFTGFQAQILRAIDPTQRAAADARFGLLQPPSDAIPVTVITRITQEHYREICRGGFCTRSNLSDAGTPAVATPTTTEPPKVGGVRINPVPLQVGRPSSDLGARILGACANTAAPACTIR